MKLFLTEFDKIKRPKTLGKTIHFDVEEKLFVIKEKVDESKSGKLYVLVLSILSKLSKTSSDQKVRKGFISSVLEFLRSNDVSYPRKPLKSVLTMRQKIRKKRNVVIRNYTMKPRFNTTNIVGSVRNLF